MQEILWQGATLFWGGYIGIMEKKMEATIGFRIWGLGFRDILGLHRVQGLGLLEAIILRR